MDIRHRISGVLTPKVDLIFDVSQITKNGKIGPPTMRLLSRSASVPNKLKRTKSCRSVVKRNSLVVQMTGGTISAPSSPPQPLHHASENSDASNHRNEEVSNNDNHYDDKTTTGTIDNQINLFKQRSNRLNHLSNVNVTCTSPLSTPTDLLKSQNDNDTTFDSSTEDGFGQFFVLSESEVEGIMVEQGFDQEEELGTQINREIRSSSLTSSYTTTSMKMPSFDDSYISSNASSSDESSSTINSGAFLERVDYRCDSGDDNWRGTIIYDIEDSGKSDHNVIYT